MKTLFATLSAALLISCGTQSPKTPILEVYTKENIYFVDIEKLRVFNEVNDTIKAFDSFTELNEYISSRTAQDVNKF